MTCAKTAFGFVAALTFSGQVYAESPPVVQTVTPPPTVRTIDAPSVPAKISISADGKSILITGPIEVGLAQRFKIILDAAPNVENLSLLSQGGRLVEATKIYEYVKERRLNTYVDQACLSACTMIFLGGQARLATPQAKIGFHQPYLTKNESLPNSEVVAAMRRFYDEANVRPSFTDRAMATPSSGMWYPSFDEMLAANVVTKRVFGGDTNILSSLFKTKSDYVNTLLKSRTFILLKAKHPEIFNELIDKGWDLRLQGKNDSEVTESTRAALMANYHKILSSADDDILIKFADMALEQGKAARDISFEACSLLVQGKLNIQQNLPEKYWKEELYLMELALSSNYSGKTVSDEEAEEYLLKTFSDFTEAEMQALGEPAKSNPIDVCNASIKMFTSIQNLPRNERALVARYIYTTP